MYRAELSPLTRGGGDYGFLHWLTRLTQRSTIIETGVAAGWTSQAFLAALKRNGMGKLQGQTP
jgi:hypothetical protein